MNLHIIATATAEHYGVSMETMRGYSRLPEHVLPRQVYCQIARERTDKSLPQIGQVISRDHTTVLGSLRRIAKFDVSQDVEAIEQIAFFDWNTIPFTTQRNA